MRIILDSAQSAGLKFKRAYYNQSSQRKPGSRHSLNLSNAVTRWPTPKARDYHSATGCERRVRSDLNVAAKMSLAGKGQLNPDWVELLMGFPAGWTRL